MDTFTSPTSWIPATRVVYTEYGVYEILRLLFLPCRRYEMYTVTHTSSGGVHGLNRPLEKISDDLVGDLFVGRAEVVLAPPISIRCMGHQPTAIRPLLTGTH